MRSVFRPLAARPLAALALAATLPLAGCIFEEESDRRPIVNETTIVQETIIYNSGIQSAVFVFDAQDVIYTVPDQVGYVEFETNLITQDIYEAGLVMLYADGALVNGIEGSSWAALPVTFGTDFDPDGDGPDLPDGFVDVTTSLGYTFGPSPAGPDRPYVVNVELQASSALGGGFDYLGRLDMRLVTIPPGEFLRARDLDFGNYEAVQRFYGLTE